MTSSSSGSTKELLENEVKPLVEQFMRDRGLQLSREKTCVTPIEHGFDFLGQHLRKFGDKKVFAVDTGERMPNGKPIWLKLVNPTEISIRRHVKIRGEANPFDPRWRAYFEDRAFFMQFVYAELRRTAPTKR